MNHRLVIVTLLVTLLFLTTHSIPDMIVVSHNQEPRLNQVSPVDQSGFVTASASGQGQQSTAVAYFSREITDLTLPVFNTYTAPAKHNGTLDFTPYHLPGWTLYQVDMVIDNLTGIAEREVVGKLDQTQNFYIREIAGVSNITQLAQGFYNQPYDGLLQNYSILHSTPIYDSVKYGDAYYVIRSDYGTSTSNITNPQALVDVGSTDTWTTITAHANLTKNTIYYTVIDANSTQKSGNFFPIIVWNSENSAGTFPTRWYQREATSWNPIQPYEALLNYTYIPWDQGANKARTFSGPEVALRANASAVTGNTVSWSSISNISIISFDSNQSVAIYHNLTLWYRRTVPAQSLWKVSVSGGAVTWNLTSTQTYPSIAEQRYLNLTKQSDWIVSGLYNSDTPSTNHSNFILTRDTMIASAMTNGTWTMVSTAPNYVTKIISLDNVNIQDKLVITNTIQEPTLTNATTGSTNLAIWNASSVVYSPANETVNNGATSYTWNIHLNTSNNGIYRIEVYWTNGTEAGYLTKQVVVYYPTTLTAKDTTISAFTNSSFDISVYFNETFTPKPIDGSYAGVSVVYSFDGGSWTTMIDHSNGTWTATISTVGVSAGSYQVRVNGSGFAIENQSIIIDVTLTYDTRSLVVAWSNTDNISYTARTNLTVQYDFVNGTPISDAFITVTDYTTTWTMHYDSSSRTYWLQFNGTDSPGLGTHPLNISASKPGYEPQYTASQSLTIYDEPTLITVTWSPANVTIHYTDSLNLQVDYTYGGGDVPAATALVNVTINGVTYPLTYTGTVWNITIAGGNIGIGIYSAVIDAWSYGYTEQTNTTSGINITLAPNSFIVIWDTPSDLNATYAELVNITVIYTHDSSPVPGATVRLYVNTTTVHDFTFSTIDERWHLQLNASAIGLGTWNATVLANSTGYDTGRQEDTMTIVTDPCTATPNWTSTTLYYTHTETLAITLLDSFGQPVTDALVNATYRGSPYILTHMGNGVYQMVIDGHDGLGNFGIQVWTWRYGLINTTLSVAVEIVETPTTGTVSTTIGGYNNTVLFYDGWVLFQIAFRDIDAHSLAGAQVNLTTSTTIYPLADQGDGTYLLNLTGEELGCNTLSGNFSADLATGYVAWKTAITLEVAPIPTRIGLMVGRIPTEMYLNQTLGVTLEYVNAHTNAPVDPIASVLTWAGKNLSYSEPSPGRFTFTISAVDLALSTHNLYILLAHENFSTQEINTDIVVRAIHTSLSTEMILYREYENETIHIEVTFTDLDRNLPVEHANINMSVEGMIYPLVYNAVNQTYSIDFRIILTPGSYVLIFSSAAEGYDSAQTSTTLIVDAKAQPVIILEFVGNVVRGAPMVVRTTLTQDGQPLNGYIIYFDITVSYSVGANTTVTLSKMTDNEGVAELSYVLPTDSQPTSVSVVARFNGDRQHWPVKTPKASRTVVVDPLREIMENITSPPGLLLIALLIVGIVAGARWHSSHKTQRMEQIDALAAQYEYFTALTSLRHLMIIYKDRGTCLFYHPFSEEQIQADLISGFISALMSMYGEIKRNGEQGSLEEINYKGLIVNSREGDYIMAILIGEKSLPPQMRNDLQVFVHKFEQEYSEDLRGWSGLMDCFDQELIVSMLYQTLHYQIVLPHTLAPDVIGEDKAQRKILKLIQDSLGDKTEFRVSNLIEPASKMLHRPATEILDIFIEMERKGLIAPIPISRSLQHQEVQIAETTPSTSEREGDEREISVEEKKIKTSPEDTDTELEGHGEADTERASVEEFVQEVERLLKEEKEKEESEED